MPKELLLIHPHIAPAGGKTKALIDELIGLWGSGRNEGGDEIAALAKLLSSEDLIPNISYRLMAEGPIIALAQAFSAFLGERAKTVPPVERKLTRDMGWKELPLAVCGMGSATGALYTALKGADVGDGDVITTSLNYPGIPNAIIMAGATPRFVDIDAKSWCMDPEALDRAITPQTRAVILTHLNRCIDLEPFYDIFKRRGLEIPLIQDASLAVGSTSHGMRPGVINIGEQGVTVFSLMTSKMLSGLGGALVATRHLSHAERLMTIAYQGLSFSQPNLLEEFGANIKMNSLSAVVAMEQLKKREEIFARRRQLKALYDEQLRPLVEQGKITLQEVDKETVITHYGLLIEDRAQITLRLYEKKRIHGGTWPVHHLQYLYKGRFGTPSNPLPHTEALADSITFLPFHTHLTDDDVVTICTALAVELKA